MQATEMRFAPDSRLVDEIRYSPNFGPRRNGLEPRLLILHYTGMPSAAKAIDWLSRPDSQVSCHYVIDDDGRVTQMVAEADRAWHAGLSYWAGEHDINSASIGIEIQNPGHQARFQPFPRRQMLAIRDLALDIAGRHGILPERVLAHSDVAPLRKIDPGEAFNWRWLAREGVGHWVPPVSIRADHRTAADSAVEVMVKTMLAAYGYGVGVPGASGSELATVVKAFQRHFRVARVDGIVDRSTVGTLERLLNALAKGAVVH